MKAALIMQRLRLISGLVLFAFVVTHFINHALGNISLEAMEAGRTVFLAIWRNPVTEILFPLTALLHFLMAVTALARRRWLKLRKLEVLQYLSGFAVIPLLAVHISANAIAAGDMGYNDTYFFVIFSTWINDVTQALLMSVGLVVTWTHGCISMHYWLRLRPWYHRASPWLFAIALLLPAAALSGFAGTGREIALLMLDEAWLSARIAEINLPPDIGAIVEYVGDTASKLVIGVIVGLLVAALYRGGRMIWKRWRQKIAIEYPDGNRVLVEVGASVLETSQQYGIPHAAVCGGRGRCSTCRVRIVAGAENAPFPGVSELKVLERVGAGEGVRLACQLHPVGDISVVPLLPSTAHPRDGFRRAKYLQGSEREIAVLFADLRAFTKFSESKLPFDVVFALNQYFRVMGLAVERSGGRLDKFIGDGVMALFGVESDKQAGCYAALVCAREMARALLDLNEQLRHDLDEPLRMGIGIHAGAAIVGEMGFREVVSLTAVGDVVNTASRLETVTKDYRAQLVVSAETVAVAGLDLSAFPRHEIEIRGRLEPLAIYVVDNAEDLPLGDREGAKAVSS